ncbi:MAG: DUF58 domain-containing protein [Planctomycetota bacterium]|nr:DUF58 domain-containing protein [Planctomycetota bacterium]
MAEADVSELLREVRQVQIVANRLVNDLLAGEYLSTFKGRGMVFDEVRAYVPGDEIRTIDWNVTARTGEAHVKRFCEERELTVLFAVDVSASGMFGSQRRSKLQTAVQVAAVLMFSALKNNDKVGLVTFAQEVTQYVPPRKGRGAVLRLIRDLLAVEPRREATDLGAALEFIGHVQRRRAVLFVMSDFMGPDCSRALRLANRRHDVIAVTLSDPRELEFPDVGFVVLEDAETGEVCEVDTRHPRVRRLFAERAARREAGLAETLRRSGIDRMEIRTDRPYAQSLQRFFKMRERRFR